MSFTSTSQIIKRTIRKESTFVHDTLIFNENMKGKILDEKFESCQNELNFYKPFINSKKINKLKILEEEFAKTTIKYLGIIKDLNDKNSYHVITDFTIIGIGSMESPRGKSKVVFINKNQDKIIIYNFPMPEDLPKLINKNILFFQNEQTKIGISIFGGLGPELCIPKIGCN